MELQYTYKLGFHNHPSFVHTTNICLASIPPLSRYKDKDLSPLQVYTDLNRQKLTSTLHLKGVM